MPAPIVRAVGVVFFFIAVASSQALACGFHPTNMGSIFERSYPGSLSVAAAVAAARSEGRIPETRLESGNLGFWKASFELRRLGSLFDLARETPKVDFFLVLAGPQLWTHYRVRDHSDRKDYEVLVHATAPVHEVPVVVTSYYAIAALREGALTFDEAIDFGLVQVSGNGGGHVAALFSESLVGQRDDDCLLPNLLGKVVPCSPVSVQQ